jgi:hypothetical protein
MLVLVLRGLTGPDRPSRESGMSVLSREDIYPHLEWHRIRGYNVCSPFYPALAVLLGARQNVQYTHLVLSYEVMQLIISYTLLDDIANFHS